MVAVSGFALFAYYTDQRFARDDWRSAVRYILSHERSNDAIVVDGPYTEPIVDYYHKDGAATIYRLTDKGPPTPEEIRTLLSELSGKHRTIWLLFWQAFYNDPQHVAAEWLDSHGALMDQQGFRGVSLLRRYSTTPVVLKADVSPSRLVGVTLEDKVGLLGYDLDESDVAELSQLYVTIYWQVLRPVDANLRVFVHLINSAYTAWGIADGRPGYYRFPTDRWQPGTIIRDEYTVPVLSGTPPGDYRLDVGMYDEATGQRLRTSDPNGDHLVLGPVTIPRQQIQPRPANTTGVTFGDHIELLGYETAAAIPPGGTLPVMLFWRANGPVEQDYKVFVHLTDRSGRPLAQSDSQPADASYPTSRWESGYTVRDQYRLQLPSDLPEGEYVLRVGMYVEATGARLPVRGTKRGSGYFDFASVRVGQ
ncbi:MAG: hypothetical protein HYY30_07505 [Chloroflexi bacterium]|nr:hypothetical protein [Chloroflexota bacterium]